MDGMQHLPQAFSHLVPPRLMAGAPQESLATCSNCSMCDGSNVTTGSHNIPQRFFNTRTKCCTYHPNLPNYAVGGILQDETDGGALGARTVKEMIEHRRGVFPSGISRPQKYGLLYRSSDAFGKALSMRCPLYVEDTGRCSIWRYREAVCSTWFCKFDNGFEGKLYWEAVADYLKALELVLIHYCLVQLRWPIDSSYSGAAGDSFSLRSKSSTTPLGFEDLDELPHDIESSRKIWGVWTGREAEMYLECYRIVNRLTPTDITRLGGLQLDLLLKRAEQRRLDFESDAVPDKLIRNPSLRLSSMQDGRFLISSYSPNHPITTNPEILRSIELFDGKRSTSEICKTLETMGIISFARPLVRQLYARRILISNDDFNHFASSKDC